MFNLYVMRKQWIWTIHGLRCSKYGSVLCAGNPWIAQHLRDPWIAQPHTCQKEEEREQNRIHDACFGCCHQNALHQSLALELLQKYSIWCLYYSSLHRFSVFHLDTVFVVANL